VVALTKFSLKQWITSKLGAGANKIVVEDDPDDVLNMPKPVPVLIVGAMDSGGAGRTNDSSGRVPTVEQNSSSINAYCSDITYGTRFHLSNHRPTVAAKSTSPTDPLAVNLQRRIVRIQVTADGAGAFAFQTIVAATAGYYGVARLVGVKANAIVAAGTLIFECPAATAELTEIMAALAANVRADRGDIHYIATDNANLGVRGTGWGAGVVVDLELEGWLET
jgi:hypothetical protein